MHYFLAMAYLLEYLLHQYHLKLWKLKLAKALEVPGKGETLHFSSGNSSVQEGNNIH